MPEDQRWHALGSSADFVNLEGIEFREYQFNIIKSLLNGENTLVILPTGLGKTLIAIFTIANIISKGKKAVILAPTKPLSEQHYSTLRRFLRLDEDSIVLLTGSTSSEKRKIIENSSKVIVATPQTIMNDLKKSFLSLNNFGVAIFDECHHAVGKYAYTYIANESVLNDVQIVGLTASPGSRKDKIKELLNTLNINNIEIRTHNDADVAKYVMHKTFQVVGVKKNEEVERICAYLRPEIESNMGKLRGLGLMPFKRFESMPKGMLIKIGDDIKKLYAKNYRFAAITSYVKLLNLIHAYDLVETEGFYPFLQYTKSLEERETKSKALSSLLASDAVMSAKHAAEDYIKIGKEHPKVYSLVDVLASRMHKKAIVFAQYRSTIKMLVDRLNDRGFNARAFVGKKEGITQIQQKQVIEDFRNNAFNVLVASSIGEEGLDIPTVDVVVFYEPIASEIRNIQRKGRTGRLYDGEVVILVTENSKDEIYFRVSQKREGKMLDIVVKLKKELKAEKKIEKEIFRGQKLL